MAKRYTLAFLYSYNENWIGGSYYIQNLISALRTLPGETIPDIYIVTDSHKQYDELVQKTKYPRLFFYRTPGSGINGMIQYFLKLTGMNKNKIDLVFPADINNLFLQNANYLFWIPDFQDHYLPQFFSVTELHDRKDYQRKMIENGQNIVFSSRTAQNHFQEIYPLATINQFVLPYAVTHNDHVSNKNIPAGYGITKDYFVCSNQFWKHKNHKIVFEAIKRLKQMGKEILVVFTGKEDDPRNPDYFSELISLINECKIEENVRMLGFISRQHQLALMNSAVAVIQPSLFEGWSTVIEDAKSFSLRVIASDIPVHQEQLSDYDNKIFFDPISIDSLTAAIELGNLKIQKPLFDYEEKRKEFAERFMEIVATINR